MALLLTKLINKGILSSNFPDCSKAAIVTPVMKSQNSMHFFIKLSSNISVTCLFQDSGMSCV